MKNLSIKSIQIRQEIPEDFTSVHELLTKAFGQNNEADLVSALRKNAEVFVPQLSLVALENDIVVGHILFTKIKIIDDLQNPHVSLALAPMAVLPDYQNNGIGSLLVKKGLEEAKNIGFTSVIVLGHEHYYPKFGFQPASQFGIRSPFEVPDPIFMAIELQTGGFKNISGVVVYPDEFLRV